MKRKNKTSSEINAALAASMPVQLSGETCIKVGYFPHEFSPDPVKRAICERHIEEEGAVNIPIDLHHQRGGSGDDMLVQISCPGRDCVAKFLGRDCVMKATLYDTDGKPSGTVEY